MKTTTLVLATFTGLLGAVDNAKPQNIVGDGGFESANAGATTGTFGDGLWTCSLGSLQVFGQASFANNGSKSVQLTYGFTDNRLTQFLATQPGQSYTLSFYVAGDDGTDPFTVMFGGQTVTTTPVSQTFPRLGTAHGTFLQELFVVTATSSSTALSFQSRFNGQGGGYGTILDDVSVTPVPEPGAFTLVTVGLIGLFGAVRRNKP